MKKLLLSSMISAAVMLTLSAQNSNFIEITVEDTINLQPVNIKYLISDAGSDNSYNYDDKKKEENKYADQSQFSQVEKILNNNKYSVSKYAETKSYRIGDSYSYDLY